VGKKGRVKGNISAEFLSWPGEVEGDVVLSRSLDILSKGRLSGDVRTPKLRVEDGAFFEGRCLIASADMKSSYMPAEPAVKPKSGIEEDQ